MLDGCVDANVNAGDESAGEGVEKSVNWSRGDKCGPGEKDGGEGGLSSLGRTEWMSLEQVAQHE